VEGADLLSRLRGVPRAPRVLAALLAALVGVAALAAVTGTASAGFVGTTSTGVSVRAAWFAYLAGTVTAFAGNGQQATTGDNGPATAAAINFPSAIAVDASGLGQHRRSDQHGRGGRARRAPGGRAARRPPRA
jgi:hypothetical protein